MAIPFQPEPVEKLKARYSEALKDTYIQLDVSRGLQSRPGEHRKHVFDFYDGIRLIVSKEKSPLNAGGKILIHYSGSVLNDGQCADIDDTYLHHIVEHFALISGDTNEYQLRMISNLKVAHFIRVLEN